MANANASTPDYIPVHVLTTARPYFKVRSAPKRPRTAGRGLGIRPKQNPKHTHDSHAHTSTYDHAQLYYPPTPKICPKTCVQTTLYRRTLPSKSAHDSHQTSGRTRVWIPMVR